MFTDNNNMTKLIESSDKCSIAYYRMFTFAEQISIKLSNSKDMNVSYIEHLVYVHDIVTEKSLLDLDYVCFYPCHFDECYELICAISTSITKDTRHKDYQAAQNFMNRIKNSSIFGEYRTIKKHTSFNCLQFHIYI